MGFAKNTINKLLSDMNRAGITQRQLAKELQVTEARVSQIFGDGSNITLRSAELIHTAIVRLAAAKDEVW